MLASAAALWLLARVGFLATLAAVVLHLVALTSFGTGVLTLQLPAAAWIAAFALYLWRFAPLMMRPRR
jgi:uncharacterized protein involved in response to NO